MAAPRSFRRPLTQTVWVALALLSCPAARSGEVEFDLPSSIECRDVTTDEFAEAHSHHKLIEAKFRISARMSDGDSTGIVDFEYFMRTGPTMRVQSYLPGTTLESAVSEDNIEITSAAENAKASGLEGTVVYKPLMLGGTHTQSTKKSESSHYRQIAAKDIVLASGTIEREHGVFFRIRPSRSLALEGGREFTFVAIVPNTWRGDRCEISCAARGTKKSLISSSVVPVGETRLEVGMYLAGDHKAAIAADELRNAQQAHAEQLARTSAKGKVLQSISAETTNLFNGKRSMQRQELEDRSRALDQARTRLETMAR